MLKRPSVKYAKQLLFGKDTHSEKDNDTDFKGQLLEQYKLAVDSLFRIRELLLMITRYNLYINVLIITGLCYCISTCLFAWAIPFLCGLGILLSFNWCKVDRHYQDWLSAQEFICMAIEKKLSCTLVSAGKKLHDREQSCITKWINKLYNCLGKYYLPNNLPKFLMAIYILGFVLTLVVFALKFFFSIHFCVCDFLRKYF